MKKLLKVITLTTLVFVLLLGAASCKKEEPRQQYCELAFVKVNHMTAQWRKPSSNFTGYGNNNLDVTVPYTNYIAFTELLPSLGAEAKTYSDEECTQPLDPQKIYIQDSRKIYIKITTKKQSRLYMVKVTVDQTNLPDGDLSAKDYDNRGGHIYIPEGAQRVMVGADEYRVIRSGEEFDRGIYGEDNLILASDIVVRRKSDERYPEETADFDQIFDGNNYAIGVIPVEENLSENTYQIRPIIGWVRENGVAKNFTIHIAQPNGEKKNEPQILHCGYSAIAWSNRGIISNIENKASFIVQSTNLKKPPLQSLSLICVQNLGQMYDCINYGDVEMEDKCLRYIAAAAFSEEISGKMSTCVNLGQLPPNGIYRSSLLPSIDNHFAEIEYIYNYKNLGKLLTRVPTLRNY